MGKAMKAPKEVVVFLIRAIDLQNAGTSFFRKILPFHRVFLSFVIPNPKKTEVLLLRMGRFRLYFFITTLLFGPLFGRSQESDIRFHHLSINDGLSQSAVNCIKQDQHGFIWIGTQDGLNLYDGYTFRVYKNDPFDDKTITNNYVWDILEDRSGKIWVATESGLNIFDKDSRTFRAYKTNNIDLSNVASWSLEEDKQGRIWMGTQHKGLFCLDAEFSENAGFTHYSADGKVGSLPYNSIRDLFVDADKNLWVGTNGGGLCLFNASHHNFTILRYDTFNPVSISDNMIWSITQGKNGYLWIGTNNGLNRLENNNGTYVARRFYHDPEEPASLSSNAVIKVLADRNGFLWVCTHGGGLNKVVMENGSPTFSRYMHNNSLPYSLANNFTAEAFEDSGGSIWVGTNNGISKFDLAKQGFSHYNTIPGEKNSLVDNNIWCFAEDPKGNLWVGHRSGLTHINMKKMVYRHFSRKTYNPKGYNDNSAISVYIDKVGQIWVGMIDGVFKLYPDANGTGAKWEQVHYRNQNSTLNDNRVYSILEDKKGFMWFGTREGLSRINKKNGQFWFCQHDPKDSTSISHNLIRSVFQSQSGDVWIGTNGGGFNRAIIDKVTGDISFERFQADPSTPDNLPTNEIMAIQEDRSGYLWLGTYGCGLVRFNPKTKKFKTYTEKNGLSNNVIYGILSDDIGELWMGTNNGLSRFYIASERFKNYHENDGLQSNEFNIGAFYKNKENRMFFGGINGFNAFYPAEIRSNGMPPQMVITDFLVFNKPVEVGGPKSPLQKHVSLSSSIQLSYQQNNLTIDFAALHYSNSTNNTYRYILENYDEEWNEVGNRQTAYFTNVPPGKYVFRVTGANSDGKWSEKEAVLTIIITPPFWNTWWFLIVALFFIIGIVISALRYRINAIKMQKRKLEALVTKRTQEVEEQKAKIESQKSDIEAEKEKAEKLLLNILPSETVEELKINGKATARNYRRVTVMFTDFKGFTKIAEELKATDLVTELDNQFVIFDKIIEKYGVEKIKTMGDAYMAAGGLPIRNKSNPIDTVLAGLEIQTHMKTHKAEKIEAGEQYWELRCGIHTGETIAGVIGTKRFAYDIWGDTVNVANRMETSGEPGKVNISGETYKFISPLFDCTYRGKVPVKNKGGVDMYFVNRIRPSLSADEEGIVPNTRFWDYVNLLLYSNINYRNAEDHILNILKKELPKNLYYHGVHHTNDVTKAAEAYGLREGITDENLYLLKTAALYHDAGFIRQYSNNEPVGVEMSREMLPQFGYTSEQIDVISGLIYATTIPHRPKSHLDEIICDADLDYLGRDDFHVISETLKKEFMEQGFVKTDRHWDEIQVKFFNRHKFFTKTAIALRQNKKEIHLAQIKARLAAGNYSDGS